MCICWCIIINGWYLIVGSCKFVTCVFMGSVKCFPFTAKELCVFAKHTKYVWKETISEYANAHWWICFKLLCMTHNKKSTSSTNGWFNTYKPTAVVNEIHLWYSKPCSNIITSNSEVCNSKIFGPYTYVCIVIKQLLCLCFVCVTVC